MDDDYPSWQECFLREFLSRRDPAFKGTVYDFDRLRQFDKAATTELRDLLYTSLRGMPYERFLQTFYWQIVKAKVLEGTRGRCSRCHSDSHPLDVHHLHYHNHGREHLWLDDLVPLCRDCHEMAFHGHHPDPTGLKLAHQLISMISEAKKIES
jgi:hypothetical protein